MANGNRFGYQQVIPHSPFIASTPKGDLALGQKEKLSSGLAKPSQASTSLSRQIHQWLGSRKASHPLQQKAYWTRLCLAVNPSGTTQKYKSNHLHPAITIKKSKCQFRLSFHIVGKGVCLVML